MQNQNGSPKHPSPIGGVLLILLGIFLLLQNVVKIPLSGGIAIGALGLFFILWGALERISGLLIPGGILSGLSIGVFLVESDGLLPDYTEGGVVLISLGVGFALITVLSTLFTGDQHRWALIVAAALGLLGGLIVIAEAPEESALKTAATTLLQSLNYLWPLALIALGIGLLRNRRAER
ncbi:MAG: hypothetical protein D6770_07815 [Anaerolineae bacterium]|nr:MAG: hypothetical protein D6770_07815 [Anaerolineae bacterium]